jgi:hypothetical protein
MAEPSEEQRTEAQRLVDEHADAARADLRTVDERYTARARLLRTGALEVVIDAPVRHSYLIDREGKIVAEAKARIGAFLVIGGLLIGVGFAGCSSADSLAEDTSTSTDRVMLISFGVAAFGFVLVYVSMASGDVRWWMKRGRGAVDPLYSGRWFDVPPTRRSPPPEGKRGHIHPLEMVDELPQSDDDGNDDSGDDGDSD